MLEHEEYMRRAVEVARGNPRAPFGTILVDVEENRQVAAGINRSTENPILHGEIDATNQYAQLNANRWSHLRLYTTAEPCSMCQLAVIWSRISEVVFGTSIETLVELCWNQIDLKAVDVAEAASFGQCTIVGGVLVDVCDRLFEMARS